jgi:hypothetical protein
MNKKTIFIGLGVLAVAGIGYYMWKKKNETTSGACGCSAANGEDSSAKEENDEESSNYWGDEIWRAKARNKIRSWIY